MDPNTDPSAALAVSLPGVLVSIVISVLLIVALWKIFEKAGEPGWAAIIPFYNTYVAFRVAGMNPWLFLLLFIPLVNFVIAIVWAIKLGAAFGKGGVWSFFLLILLPFIGYVMLGFGSATYRKPALA